MPRAAKPRRPQARVLRRFDPGRRQGIQRNRAKRRMREIFRRNQELLPQSCDLLLARRSVNQWPFVQLDRAFTDACGRIAAPAAPLGA